MSEFQEPLNHTTTGTPRWVGIAVAVLVIVALLIVAQFGPAVLTSG